MRLTNKQLADYDRDGFLLFPELIPAREVAVLKAELSRVLTVKDERIIREKVGGPRIVYGLHDLEGPTGSRAFEDLACSAPIFEPATQILGDENLSMFHSKCNLKDAIDGDIWQWHQDYFYWQRDGIPTPNLVTTLVMLDEATEIGGCLYFVPGSHKLGCLEPEWDDHSTSFALWTVPKPTMIDIIEKFGDPVAIKGKPGTVAMFHPNIVHGSGHNMSARARWQLYYVFNPVANKPLPVEKSRPEWQVSRLARPLVPLSETAPR